MKLLNIKAHGFKSFADKIEINVMDGITGIVGPNGSGKSNIVDAIKWVLGEQSIKNLRGSTNMTDVIFQGSNSRKELTRAWVSLTFDNSDHYLNSDLSTIEIKRVVYSTGENEYYINNAVVRLKDITELFIDSGASTNSFSIIGQGKISELLSGKKEDRRAILEEAAGVLKYKKRKEETLRKIDRTNENIEKVDLIINELNQNLLPLKQQALEAEKYIDIKSKYDDIDLKITLIDIRDLKEKTINTKNEIDSINNEIVNIDSSSSTSETEVEKLKLNVIKLDNDINKYSEELLDLTKQISDCEATKQVTIERQKYQVDDIKLKNNIISLKESELSLKKNIKVIENEIDVLKDKLELDNNKLDNYNNDYKIQYLNKNNYNIDINKKKTKEFDLSNKISILENNIENDSKIPNSVRNLINNNRIDGIHNIVGKLINTSEMYGVSLNVALGYNSNVVVVDDEKTASEAIKYLKNNNLGRCTFFPLNIIKPKYIDNNTLSICNSTKGFIGTLDSLVSYNNIYKSIIQNLLGNIIVVDNINTMNELGKIIHYTYRIVTLDGEILHTGGSITGGSIKTNNSIIMDKFELNTAKHDLINIKNDIRILEENINRTEEEINIINNNAINVKNIINDLTNKIDIKNKNLIEYKNKLTLIENEIRGTKNVLDNNIDSELNELLEKFYKLNSEKDIISNKISELKLEKNDISSKINEIELNNKKVNSNYNKLLTNLKNLEIEQSKNELKLDNNLIKLNEEYSITYENALNKCDLEIDVESSRIECNRYKQELSSFHDINTGSIAEYERVNERFTFLSEQKNDLINSINNLMDIITDLDKTMIDKFSITFDRVNNEFNNVFKKLFKGGSAKLLLTDKNDLLNTGIDIIAEPPGKTLKSINLLSGGEKTLTAIALLFSILNIRVVPFCILDEVEAALDEANVDTFGNYLSEYKEKTQFIIITHKKRTMEFVNTLYGLTMQESGVSKLVSVKLNDIKK